VNLGREPGEGELELKLDLDLELEGIPGGIPVVILSILPLVLLPLSQLDPHLELDMKPLPIYL